MKKLTNFKRNAFTLAEVLITLGIIGVVAAMTMPTLLNSTQGAQYRTAYKKALSVLSQAVVMNVALDDYDLAQTIDSNATDGTSASLYNLFNNRMNVAKVCDGSTSGSGQDARTTCSEAWTAGNDANAKLGESDNYTFFFNDGITLSFPKTNGTTTKCEEDSRNCRGVIDVNGAKNPNRVVSCNEGSNDSNCKVTNPTDIYPVIMYAQSVLPNSPAARAVLFGGK